jgi:hypothetical protein
MRLSSLILIVTSALVAGCGSSGSTGVARPPTATTPSPAAAGLVGRWQTTNVCSEEVRAFHNAGVAAEGKGFLQGEYAGMVQGARNPCRGAQPKQHSHGFGADGSFASYDENGMQVDDGAYQRINDHTLTLGKPAIRVHYRIDGDRAAFVVISPHCRTERCRKSLAYVVSAFFPRTYDRVG